MKHRYWVTFFIILFMAVFPAFGGESNSDFCEDCYSELAAEAWNLTPNEIRILDSDHVIADAYGIMEEYRVVITVHILSYCMMFRVEETRFMLNMEFVTSEFTEGISTSIFEVYELRKKTQDEDSVRVAGMLLRDVECIHDFLGRFGEGLTQRVIESTCEECRKKNPHTEEKDIAPNTPERRGPPIDPNKPIFQI